MTLQTVVQSLCKHLVKPSVALKLIMALVVVQGVLLTAWLAPQPVAHPMLGEAHALFGWFKKEQSEDASEKTADKTKAPKASSKKAKLEEKPSSLLAENEGVKVTTRYGNIYIALFPKEAPVTVENFVTLVKKGFYNTSSMKFHRVIPGFVVQTGDPTGTGAGGSGKTIPLEVKNRLVHKSKGFVAMARGPEPNSASSQFYITLAPQPHLDGKYAVFGQVVAGNDVLDKIKPDDAVLGVAMTDLSSVQPDETFKASQTNALGAFLHYFTPDR